MTRYMLDTNILTAIVRDPDGAAARKFADLTPDEVCISIVVSSEVRFGLAKNEAVRSRAPMMALLESLDVEALDTPADQTYARVRAELARRGRSISPNDYLVVAHALVLDAVLVTDDQAIHQAAVPGLRVENWLRADAAPTRMG